MFQIKVTHKAIETHYLGLKTGVIDKIKEILDSGQLQFDKDDKFIKLLNWFLEQDLHGDTFHLRNVILCEPNSFMDLYAMLRDRFLSHSEEGELWTENGIMVPSEKSRYKTYLKDIFDYKNFVSNTVYGAYTLTHNLNVRVCPYCNRHYTFTVGEFNEEEHLINRVVRPELDHYFAQSQYPMFALSFFNLIPCCHTCNSNVKNRRPLNINDHYHPYIPETKMFEFKFTLIDDTHTAISLNYHGSQRAKKTCQFFKLDQIYMHHANESDKIHQIYEQYSLQRLRDIREVFLKQGILVSEEQLIEIIYSHYVVENPDEELLGKLKTDLFQQIKSLYKIDTCSDNSSNIS